VVLGMGSVPDWGVMVHDNVNVEELFVDIMRGASPLLLSMADFNSWVKRCRRRLFKAGLLHLVVGWRGTWGSELNFIFPVSLFPFLRLSNGSNFCGNREK
jgi:hypothetical protein